MDPDFDVVRDYLTGLQDRICAAIEAADGRARFAAISPLVYRLLELLATGGHSGRASLQVLAAEAGVPADDAFLAQGQAMLQRMHEEGTVLGTRL